MKPNDTDNLLIYIRRFCQPHTCAAITFLDLVEEIGNHGDAERAIKSLWRQGYVYPTGRETDPEDGALFEVETPNIDEPLRNKTQFVLSDQGYAAVEILHSTKDEENIDGSKDPESQIVIVSSRINALLLKMLKKDPDKMLSLAPRQFEELVAELFVREGFDVELTPQTRDGGRDVIAVKFDDLGYQLYLTECKRYDAKRPVGVEFVRSLYGVVEAERASRGIIATTSYFSSDAKSLAEKLKWRVSLRDYDSLKQWIKNTSM